VAFQLWAGRAVGVRRASVGYVLALLCFGGGYALVASGQLIGVLIGLLGVAVLIWSTAMTHVGVVVNAYGVRIHHGLLPPAVINLPVRRIRSITTTHVGPTLWHRWGWTWVPGRSRAVVVRSGPALAIELTTGKRVVVSVDQPEGAITMIRRVGLVKTN
jgi:hypothetical protein